MPKQGEIDYLRNIGEEGRLHAANKPFSDPECAHYLCEMGAVMLLLPPPPARLLDLGCGMGWTSVFFARRGYDVTGIDISEDMISHAEEHRRNIEMPNLRFVVADYEDLAFSGEFDCALFFDSLHHAVDEEKALAAAFKALREGGVCALSEPGKGHAQSEAAKQAVTKYGVTEKDMPPVRLRKLGLSAGFRKVSFFPHASQLNDVVYGDIKPRFFPAILRSAFMRTLAAAFISLFLKRSRGIVVMTK